jgi:hypothetical protein
MTKDEALKLALDALEYLATQIKPDYEHSKAITAIKATLEANEFNPDWDTQSVLTEEIQRMAKRIEELEAKGEIVACGACNGSGRMVRDPDIGTDQECFVCEGTLEAKGEPVQKPVAWMYEVNHAHTCLDLFEPPDDAYDEGTLYPLYTIPPQRKPLTDEEIDTIGATIFKAEFLDDTEVKSNRELARAIEAAHGIKGEA